MDDHTYPIYNPAAKVEMPYMCEALVDQGRMIGNDPVGYACSRPATLEHQSRALLCAHCANLLLTDPGRISLPNNPLGRAGQVKLAGEVMADLLRAVRNRGSHR